jgi:prepilin-type N-terminal cleavage/methylation domain-containing protein
MPERSEDPDLSKSLSRKPNWRQEMSNRKGFTLIELLIVVVIIGIDRKIGVAGKGFSTSLDLGGSRI